MLQTADLQAISHEPLLFVGGMSRSGTTLLTTVLDAHPAISMGTELIPGQIDPPPVLLDKLETALALADGKYSKAGRALAKAGDYPVGVFFSRCCRAGVTLEELQEVLHGHAGKMQWGVNAWRDRLTLAWAVMRQRWLREQTAMFGFKLNASAIVSTATLFPEARFICIVRDPQDVVYSHLKNQFSDDTDDVVRRWNLIVAAYDDYAKANPQRCALVRYEDLVRSPYRTLQTAFRVLPVGFDPVLVSFQTSQAAAFKASDGSRHPNLDQLRKGFFLQSIGTGRRELPAALRSEIETTTQAMAGRLGYDGPGLARRAAAKSPPNGVAPDDLIAFDKGLLDFHRKRLRRRRRFHIDEYQRMLDAYLSSHEVMRLCDYVRMSELGDRKVLLIRHDIDHDIENAVQLAEWEHARGVASTYCVLHTAWYYGERQGNAYRHSRLLVESVERILDLGHEINFHNNLLALALTEGTDPEAMLRSELEFWDRRGVAIVGTSMHGDGLCRQLDFRNSEFFRECVEERFGGVRTISHTPEESGPTRSIQVGQASMFDFGLEYEAYDMARDIYRNDSGGHMRMRTDTRGRRAFGRDEGRGEVVGILTHPIWWQL